MNISKPLQKLDPILLSDYILQNYGPMSHLKLQKLLYYCDAYNLAYFGEPLIDEQFEAWVHGPVCREVYNSLRDKSILYSDVAFNGDYNPSETVELTLTSDQQEVITHVLANLSKWTGLELEAATHDEDPWREARKGYAPGEKCSKHISKETMLRFYLDEINS